MVDMMYDIEEPVDFVGVRKVEEVMRASNLREAKFQAQIKKLNPKEGEIIIGANRDGYFVLLGQSEPVPEVMDRFGCSILVARTSRLEEIHRGRLVLVTLQDIFVSCAQGTCTQMTSFACPGLPEGTRVISFDPPEERMVIYPKPPKGVSAL